MDLAIDPGIDEAVQIGAVIDALMEAARSNPAVKGVFVWIGHS